MFGLCVEIKVHTPRLAARLTAMGRRDSIPALDDVLGSTVSPKKYKVNTSPSGSKGLEAGFVSVVLLVLAHS